MKESAVFIGRMADTGISSLPPGRLHTWLLGQGFNLIAEEGSQKHTFTICADGPFGTVPPVSCVIDLSVWRGQVARAEGSLNKISKSIEGLAGKVNNLCGYAATLAAKSNSAEERELARMTVEPSPVESESGMDRSGN